MATASKIVDRSEALNVPPAAPVSSEPAKVVRFVRTMSPDQPLELANGTVVSFHIPVDNVTRARAAYGWYETSDAAEIKLLREVVAQKPYLYVFEQ